MIGKLRTGLVRWCRKFGQRRNREDCLPSDHTDMAGLSSNPRWLHTNDKRLLRILLGCACLSVFLQKTFILPDPSIAIRKSEAILDARVFYTPNHTASTDGHDTTIVTAYFRPAANGDTSDDVIEKGDAIELAETFKTLENPLVIFTDSEAFANHVRQVRNSSKQHKTRIILVERNSSWAFRWQDTFENLLGSSRYRSLKSPPLSAEQACAKLAKYDVVARAARDNFFKSKYYTWVDLSVFSHIHADISRGFYFSQPRDFNSRELAMTLLNASSSLSLSPQTIFANSLEWIGGNIFSGSKSVVLSFEKQLRKAVEYFLSQELASGDEQFIYAMYTKKGRKSISPKVHIQVYSPMSDGDKSYLAHLMVHEKAQQEQ